MLFVGRGLENHLVFLLRFPSKGPFIFKGVGGWWDFTTCQQKFTCPPLIFILFGVTHPQSKTVWRNSGKIFPVPPPPLKPLFFGWPPFDPTSPPLPKKWTVPNVFQFVNSPYHFYYNNIILSIIYLYFSIIDCNLHFIIVLFYFGF